MTKIFYFKIWLPIIYNQLISGTSVRILRHYKQLVDSDGLFRMYDYGKRGNFQLYNSEKPPIYPLRNILVPIHLIYGKKDEITTAEVCIRITLHFKYAYIVYLLGQSFVAE